ncbi:MAG: inositol monophosphatase, partial [Actinomyces sp.]
MTPPPETPALSPPADPHELLALADAAVDRALPRLLEARRRGGFAVDTKSSTTDMVTELDRSTEHDLVDTIRRARPDDAVIGEEGTDQAGASGVTWLIDPIDGTTNFLYDLPGWSISVAAAVGGRVVAGLVHDPVRGERFRAVAGGGATRDGETIQVSGLTDPSVALVATGFAYDRERRVRQARVLTAVIGRVRDIRRFGGAALDLCALACGRVDAYYERGLGPWDLAAGALIAAEAGARVLDRSQAGGAIVAATPGIFEEL